jgi:hypothetical protein
MFKGCGVKLAHLAIDFIKNLKEETFDSSVKICTSEVRECSKHLYIQRVLA